MVIFKCFTFDFQKSQISQKSTNVDTSDINMVHFVDVVLNTVKPHQLLGRILQMRLPIIGAESNL